MSHYIELIKPKVVLLLVFTAVVGMFLASPNAPDYFKILISSIGIGLMASAGAVINHIYDKETDSKMSRTENRPVATGSIDEKNAITFAIGLGMIGVITLIVFVNTLTALLTFLSLIGYAFVYTVLLKYSTPQNIVIGGASGATPPLLGWVAISNEITVNAVCLFLIIFTWTPPHFWALALAKKDEYQKAKVPMLPITHGIKYTKISMGFYLVILWFVSLLPILTGLSGSLYFWGANVLMLGFILLFINSIRVTDKNNYMLVFAYSITYLAALFIIMVLDQILIA